MAATSGAHGPAVLPAGISAGPAFLPAGNSAGRPQEGKPAARNPAPGPSQAKTKPGQLALPDWQRCEDRLKNSVVRIEINRARQQSVGTGFAVGDGTLIVTNEHVIALAPDGEGIAVERTDGKRVRVAVRHLMPHRDLALLSTDEPLPPLVLADDEHFMWSTPVMVLGHGLAIQNLRNTGQLTELRSWEKMRRSFPRAPIANDTLVLKFDANAHAGHSGSPVATPDALVVGA
jgi:S1-C subfamily serine protease